MPWSRDMRQMYTRKMEYTYGLSVRVISLHSRNRAQKISRVDAGMRVCCSCATNEIVAGANGIDETYHVCYQHAYSCLQAHSKFHSESELLAIKLGHVQRLATYNLLTTAGSRKCLTSRKCCINSTVSTSCPYRACPFLGPSSDADDAVRAVGSVISATDIISGSCVHSPG